MAHAIVIGGSVAGLLAARVLADHYEQVTVVERDTSPGHPRRSVPYTLLASECRMLDEVFPRIADHLIAAGALKGGVVGRPRGLAGGRTGLLVSGPLLEGTIRDRVASLSNVGIRHGASVRGLAAHGGRVTGIKVGGGETLPAELVVDSTGSQSPRWLDEIGYPKPPEDRIELGLGQTTRQFHCRPADLSGGLAVIIYVTADGKRGGLMAALEGRRWTVTLASRFGKPPGPDGFIEFGRMLPGACIYRTLLNAEPAGEPASTWFPTSLRRRYEKVETFPEGFVVLDDVISSADPVFGHGLSSAALRAAELGKTLAEGHGAVTRRFFERAAKIDGAPRNTGSVTDTGPRSARVDLANWYLSKAHTMLFRGCSQFGPTLRRARVA